MNHLWSNWSHLGWIVVSSLAIYLWILLVLRLNGLRTFAAFSGYDFVITVAVGSIVACAVLSPSVSLLDGIIGTAALIVCQRAVTAGRRRLRRVERIVDNEPVVLLAHGQPIAGNLTRTGITLDVLTPEDPRSRHRTPRRRRCGDSGNHRRRLGHPASARRIR